MHLYLRRSPRAHRGRGRRANRTGAHEATSSEAIRKHASLSDLPVDEIIAIADRSSRDSCRREQMLAGLDGIAEDVVFVFDLAKMGERALLRAVRAADQRDLRAHLVLLPAGTSVPQLIVDKGAEHVQAGLKQSTRIPRDFL